MEPSSEKDPSAEFPFGGEIVRLSEIELINSKPVALHGMSAETLLHAARTGFIPGSSEFNFGAIRPADIFVYPILQNFPQDHPILSRYIPQFIHKNNENNTPEDWIQITAGIAKDIARKHAFVDLLGIPFSNSEASDWALSLFDQERFPKVYKEAVEYFESLGKSHEEIERAIRVASERKGVVIGLDSNVINDFELEIRGDLVINTARTGGLSLTYLTAIQPMGVYEREVIDNLKG